jgi:hypothetical protein
LGDHIAIELVRKPVLRSHPHFPLASRFTRQSVCKSGGTTLKPENDRLERLVVKPSDTLSQAKF